MVPMLLLHQLTPTKVALTVMLVQPAGRSRALLRWTVSSWKMRPLKKRTTCHRYLILTLCNSWIRAFACSAVKPLGVSEWSSSIIASDVVRLSVRTVVNNNVSSVRLILRNTECVMNAKPWWLTTCLRGCLNERLNLRNRPMRTWRHS